MKRTFVRIAVASSRRRGSSLAITMILVTLTAMALLWLSDAVVQLQRINHRKGDLGRAFYAAEGGVALIHHFGLFPDKFTKDPTLFVHNGGSTATSTYQEIFPNIAATLAAGSYTITESELDSMGYADLKSQYGTDVATIRQITLEGANASDPVTCFFKVRSVGHTISGVERTVVHYMVPNIATLKIKVPAGLLSFNTAVAFGNARVHWGESWSKGNFTMLNRSQMDYLIHSSANYDPAAKYKSEGTIFFPPNWSWGDKKDLYDPSRQDPGAAPASGKYAGAFNQRLPSGTLTWPDFDYQSFKEQALAHGRYYSTDAAGNIYKNGIKDAAHKVDFYTEFTVPDRNTSPYDLIFIDTIDGHAPNSLGTNLATIKCSGNGNGTKGIMYIAANFDAGGVGSPPSMTAKDPNGVIKPLSQIFHDGVIYASGTIAMSGNAGVYGAVVTQRGFAGGGTPDIWYNTALANGLEYHDGNAGSVFKVVMTNNY